MFVEFSRILVPPVRLPEPDALAREARRAPLFDAAARIAARLGAGAPLGPDGLPCVATPGDAAAWDFALAAGLAALAGETAVPGDILGRLDALTADETLTVWRAGVAGVLGEAGAETADADADPDRGADDDSRRAPAPTWDDAAERAYTDAILRVLYVVAALEARDPGAPAPAGLLTLPALAALLLDPEGPETEEDDGDPLDGISDAELLGAVTALTDRLAPLAAAGLVDHTPGGGAGDDAFGTVRITPLGLLTARDRFAAEAAEAVPA